VSATLTGWAKQAVGQIFHFHRLKIGSRLTLCFVFIILAMLEGNAVLLFQFYQVRAQADRLSFVDQELIAVLQAHTKLMSFYERLDELAHSEDTDRLAVEAEALQNALLEDYRRSKNALGRLASEAQLDPALLPTLEAIQHDLQAQLEAIISLARSRDWRAVRLRLSEEVRPLESRSAALVESIDREVGEERAQALLNMGSAQRRVLLIVPITAMLTLLFAGVLGWVVTHGITQPLGRLMEASKALGRGEFQHRVPVIGQDELAHLGRVFNDTAGTLRDLYQTLSSKEAYLTEAQRLSHTGEVVPSAVEGGRGG
jgi:methyl-accepting chemotaxis protein